MPISAAISSASLSVAGSSTPNASEMAIASAPRSRRSAMAAARAWRSAPSVTSSTAPTVSSVRPGASPNASHLSAPSDTAEVRPSAEAQHPDGGGIALEQSVHRLGGRVRDAGDRSGPVARDLARDLLDDARDPGGDAVGVVVRGKDAGPRHDGQRGDVAGHRLREGSTDVHADADGHALNCSRAARAAAAARSPLRCPITNSQIAPADVDRGECDLGNDRFEGRVPAGQVGEEDRQSREPTRGR